MQLGDERSLYAIARWKVLRKWKPYIVSARFLISALVVLLAWGVAHPREPYVFGIVEEEGSSRAVEVDIATAEQADVMAQGYKEWNILGKKIYLEGRVKNLSEEALMVALTFTARDVFGKALHSCEAGVRLEPGGEGPFKCELLIKDARNLNRVTYRVDELGP